jgi:divalent metal cation (Fe/Co/Zn/Cd) transporter
MRTHGHAHVHLPDATDPVLAATTRASRVVLWSFAGLCATTAFQAAVAWYSGSIALLADTIHNAGDAATAIPLWIAFRYARRKPDRKFTYGAGEDLAGSSSWAPSGQRDRRRDRICPAVCGSRAGRALAVVLAAVGFLGNEAVALYRIRVGKAIGSAALVADGRHARADGLTSLAVLVGAAGVAAGVPSADPAVGLLLCLVILKIVWDTGKEVFLRLLDGVEPGVGDEIRETVRASPGVKEVTEVRVRWSGHRIYAEVNLAVEGNLSVEEGHAIAMEARHRLLHRLAYLSDATIHVDPPEASGTSRHATAFHAHGGLPGHGHR